MSIEMTHAHIHPVEPVAVRPLNRREQAKLATRARLIEAARFLFTNAGYFDTGIRDVADAMSMSTGAVFAHVGTKEDLWRLAMNGPAPSQALAEEVALVQALRPGWQWLIRSLPDGRHTASVSSPDYHALQGRGRCHVAVAYSPASALRDARIEAERTDPAPTVPS